MCLLDTIDWPTAFLGAIKAGVVAGAGQHADDRGRLPFHAARQPRAAPRRLRRAAAEIRKAIAAVGRSRTRHRLRRAIARPAALRRFAGASSAAPKAGMTAPTTRDDMCFWLYTSGSTGKPKGAVHTHADLKLTDELYAGPILGITENDICYSVAKLFFAYGLGNALTFPMSAGATTVLLRAAADAGSRRRSPEKTPGHGVLRRADFLCRLSREPRGAAARRAETAALRVGRRSAADRYRPALERALRHRHSRRPRLDRDAAHFPQQPRRAT